jgi:8-oxo-dGTP diphosphatase
LHINQENCEILVVWQKKVLLFIKSEFSGGKMKVWETEENCILREIKEQLDIDIKLVQKLIPSAFKYPINDISLIQFLASHIVGGLKLAEHRRYKWLRKDWLTWLDWAEANLPIMNEYLELWSKEFMKV